MGSYQRVHVLCVHVCSRVRVLARVCARAHVGACAHVCACAYVCVRVCVRACAVGVQSLGGCSPAVDACSGDSIVSMSKDLLAALFHHVFIMLIQRKTERGRRESGRREKGEGMIARQTERRGNLSPSSLRPRLLILTTSSVPSIPLYFPFFLSPHPLHLPLSYLPPLLL